MLEKPGPQSSTAIEAPRGRGSPCSSRAASGSSAVGVLGDLQDHVGQVAGQGALHLDAAERLEADVDRHPEALRAGWSGRR